MKTDKQVKNELINQLEYFGWIDFLKGLAIIAVVIDHTYGNLYTNSRIQLMSYYSVTLFIILAGVTSYISMEKRRIVNYDFSYVLRRLKSLAFQYISATIIIITYSMRFFDFKIIVSSIVNFTAATPFYFIVFFSQLIIVSPILYLTLKRIQKIRKTIYKVILLILTLAILIKLGLIFTKYTLVLPVHGGGKHILGGSYLPIFFVGMIFASFNFKIKTLRFNVIFTSTILILLLIFMIQMFDSNSYVNRLNVIFSIWHINPPGTIIFIYTVLIFLTFWSFYILCKSVLSDNFMKIFKPVETCGKYSMDIFLYHLLALNITTNIIIPKIDILDKYYNLVSLCILLFIIGGPILAKVIYEKLKKYIKTNLYISLNILSL